MLLENKVAVIYGAGGAVGGAVAKAFAKAGAHVFLAGRTVSKLQTVATQINSEGGTAEVKQVDALDKESIERCVDEIVEAKGRVDISFNLISLDDVHGHPLEAMRSEDFTSPVTIAMNTHFLTTIAAVHHMKKQGSGVIMALTANAGHKPFENSGGFGVACAAIEGFCRQAAVEVGKYGIRVVCLRSAGSPDAPAVAAALDNHAAALGVPREQFEKDFAASTMLKRLPLLKEVANAAVLMASDNASAITAAVVNVTCGEIAD